MASAWIFSTVAVSVLVLVASDPCVPPGDFLSGLTGTFSSPNFSANFPTNSHCNWTIEVPAGRIIKVTFFSFALDPTHNTNCLGDTGIPHVFISNVASDDAASEFKICGARLPNPVYSVGNSIQVRLVTGTNGYQGFNASYEAIDEGQLCPESVILTERTGVIQSPYNPRKYPDNLTCIWEITAPQGNHVKLEIDALNIQECDRATCPCDYLQIYDAFSKDPNDNKRICGPQSSKIFYSIHESLKVQFVSDGTKSKRFEGFKATYTILRNTPPIFPPEPIHLSGNGKLSSPNYPLTYYPAHTNSSWVITVSHWKRVEVEFLELSLGSCQVNDECTFVELYDGPSATSSLLERFYNGSTPRRVPSSGNQVFVNFRSGSSLDWGFEAQYGPMNLCDQILTGGPYGIVNVTDDTATLRLAGKKCLSNGNQTRYIQIILIQRKDEDQDIGSSTDERYAVGKVKDSSEEGKPYIIAQFDYGDEETFTIGDDKYYKTGSREYHNGKLKSNTYYAAFQRYLDGSGNYDSEKFVKFKTAEKPGISLTVFIVVVVVVALVLGISGAVGGFLYAKRRWKLVPIDSNKEMEDVSPDKIPVSKSDTSF